MRREAMAMKKLNEKEWRTFPAFSDDGLFHIATTSSSIDAVRLKDGDDKTVPYVTRSDMSNGVARFVSAENYDFGSDDGGCITVGLDTQTAFYQPHKFVTGQNVHVVTGEQLSEEVAFFLVTILREQMQAKFNWGGNGATLGRMKRLLVMLPVNDNGKPDYGYMAQYASEMRGGMLMRYRNYVAGQLSQLEYKDIPALDEKVWHEYALEELFSVGAGKRLTNADKIEGNRPFIGATDNSNGITGFVGNSNTSYDKNVLGVNYNGAPCIAFYHPYECIFSDDVKRLHLLHHEDNEYVLLFFKAIVMQQRTKYSYGYKFKEKRMLRQKLMIPVDNDGKPDYAYMEQYAKNMMLRKYEQYLAFLSGKEEKA